MLGPPGEKCLENAGEGAFADGHAAGNTDHIGDLRSHRAKEGGGHLVEVLCGTDVEVQQTGERQVDRGHLVEVDLLVDATQRLEVLFADREGSGGAQVGPFVARKGYVTVEIEHLFPPGRMSTASRGPMAKRRHWP